MEDEGIMRAVMTPEQLATHWINVADEQQHEIARLKARIEADAKVIDLLALTARQVREWSSWLREDGYSVLCDGMEELADSLDAALAEREEK